MLFSLDAVCDTAFGGKGVDSVNTGAYTDICKSDDSGLYDSSGVASSDFQPQAKFSLAIIPSDCHQDP